MSGFVRDSIMEDVRPLAANLRPSDTSEIFAASGLSNEAALKLGLQGDVCKTICDSEGNPVAIFGTNPTEVEGLGSIWMVATTGFNKVQRQFLRECRDGISDLGKKYKALYNYTDARNKLHHRWLKWCGFVFIKQHNNFGKQGEPFIEFIKITGE